MKFLLLRPQAKCRASAQAFKFANLPAVACGLIDTVLDDDAIRQLPAKIADLHNSTVKNIYVIVTSTMAAQQCVLMKNQWPENLCFYAVGATTGDILQQAGLVVTVPKEARTEGLLALHDLNNVSNQVIVIMKGFGGRELLYDTLVSRGAKVEEWEVYKRVKLDVPVSTQDWRTTQIRCIIATSGEVIHAAFDYFEASWLKRLNWIVVSQRTADIASKLGATQIDISRDASDQALIQCAQQFDIRARHSSEH
ncbi:uroporphyrinogen-III synthase [Paraglaciecola arctica]|uniref:Uroporphyrinogen-III synthase n=1 Tax=Paraglaciecola arctica BSs20135 TaxID=493475 RepID=K6ZE90_9ALTE|nr:uroporphyrinogen-III synthase [Paraglaciecola arctica]GAC21730.1 uroporphyrinogen-III synthase [Paraglaciecola arctica BSs20135]